MHNLLQTFFTLESLAVILAIAYLLLAAEENVWCWVCAFVSSVLYVWIMFHVRLYMESVLNGFYAVMAVVGWQQWEKGGADHHGVKISTMPWQQHVMLIAAMVVLALVNGYIMQRYTQAAFPLVDSFTTWSSVVTTFLVIRKKLENWIYWFVIDGISIALYINRGLYLTAGLFAVYVVIVVFGFLHWLRLYKSEKTTASA